LFIVAPLSPVFVGGVNFKVIVKSLAVAERYVGVLGGLFLSVLA
jgi:hypothetical protein